MSRLIQLAVAAGAAMGLSVAVTPIVAGADSLQHGGPPLGGANHAVFVQTDNPAGNQVVAYSRSFSGALVQDGMCDTGGLGGVLNGSVVDHLASQGSLAYGSNESSLYAVNAIRLRPWGAKAPWV